MPAHASVQQYTRSQAIKQNRHHQIGIYGVTSPRFSYSKKSTLLKVGNWLEIVDSKRRKGKIWVTSVRCKLCAKYEKKLTSMRIAKFQLFMVSWYNKCEAGYCEKQHEWETTQARTEVGRRGDV